MWVSLNAGAEAESAEIFAPKAKDSAPKAEDEVEKLNILQKLKLELKKLKNTLHYAKQARNNHSLNPCEFS
ncbi:hypothetical protein [Ornithinibacillus xuwenensis]|uniref:Transposase n=1 Tax=Ornithinibacillus xuwenensis TaxID=3144668 RepID=A0ABU9XJI7_9BACI